MGEKVKLFRTWSSPFSLRVVWALKLKGVEYETIYEDLTNKSAELLEYNPIHKKIPVLIHNGKPIVESLVILEYIDETWKQNPLLPDDPHQRALARFWAKFADEKVLPSIWEAFAKQQGKEQEKAQSKAVDNLQILEQQLKGKKLFGGDEIGFVDIALGSLANLVTVFEEISHIKLIDQEKFPLLSTWTQVFADLPLINENWPPRDELVTKFRAIREFLRMKEA